MSLSQPTSIPPPDVFLASLFSILTNSPCLSSDLTAKTDSPTISAAAKPTLLTLHALFPTLLLPALDLLDRRLVTRFILQDEPIDRSTVAEEANQDGNGKSDSNTMVYYVKSTAQRDGRSRYSRSRDVGGTSYEVRTRAWSCTCHAFAFAAYNGAGASPAYKAYEDVDDFGGRRMSRDGDEEMLDVPETETTVEQDGPWQWGGLMLEGEDIPLCKHLLACVLVERWDMGGSKSDEKVVGREEMAGWAAGWGG